METIRLRDLGTSDDPEITGFDMLLSSGALEEYAEKAVNNPSLAGILERVRNEAAEQDSNLKLCLMAGYALSDRRAVVIDGTPYETDKRQLCHPLTTNFLPLLLVPVTTAFCANVSPFSGGLTSQPKNIAAFQIFLSQPPSSLIL